MSEKVEIVNEIEAAVEVLNDALRDAWDVNIRVDVYIDKHSLIRPIFYD